MPRMLAIFLNWCIWIRTHFSINPFATQPICFRFKTEPPKIRQQSIIKRKNRNADDAVVQTDLPAEECVYMAFLSWMRKMKADSKNGETNVEQQISGGCRVNENKWYKNVPVKTRWKSHWSEQKYRHKLCESVCCHGVSSPAVEIATHFWIAYFVLWQMCVFVFSRLLPFLHCSLYLSPSIFASFSQVRFFFGTKAFLWPIVCVLVEFVAFANLFVYSHMVRTRTNAHCYRNAGHHSYRMKEWELQLPLPPNPSKRHAKEHPSKSPKAS